MNTLNPYLQSYWLFPPHASQAPWPIELQGEDPAIVHLLGDGLPARLRQLIADRDEASGVALTYPDSAIATYDVREVVYPGNNPGRIIRHSSGANLETAFGGEGWWNQDGDGWLHSQFRTLPDRDEYELAEFDDDQPVTYQVQFYVPVEGVESLGATWADVLGLTLDTVDLPVEKHYHDGTTAPDGTVPGRRARIAPASWTHSDTRRVPVNAAGIQSLLNGAGRVPPPPWNYNPTDPEDPCYDEGRVVPRWPVAFGSPARYYGPEYDTTWALRFIIGRAGQAYRVGLGVVAYDDAPMASFVADLNPLEFDGNSCPVFIDGSDALFNDTPAELPPVQAMGIYAEEQPWVAPGFGGPPEPNDPIECEPAEFPLPSTYLGGDWGDHAVAPALIQAQFHALLGDEGPTGEFAGFHDPRADELATEATDLATETTAAFLEGGDGLVYEGELGELPRPHSAATGVFCGRSLTLPGAYSLDVLVTAMGAHRVALVDDGRLIVWDWDGEEARELWDRPIAESFPPDVLAELDETPPAFHYRMVTASWPHPTGLLKVGGCNLIISVPDRQHDLRYRVPGGKPPIITTFGWRD